MSSKITNLILQPHLLGAKEFNFAATLTKFIINSLQLHIPSLLLTLPAPSWTMPSTPLSCVRPWPLASGRVRSTSRTSMAAEPCITLHCGGPECVPWTYCRSERSSFNTLRPRQNGRHFADAILKCIFLNENVWIPIEISLKFVPKGPIDNIPALV